MNKKITIKEYQNMIMSGSKVLTSQMQRINALNVFPVPDGDTGTNMNMTMQSGSNAITNKDFTNFSEISKAISKGMLLGARGNSGVILSQFFRGLAEKMPQTEELTIEEFQKSLKQGKTRAYASVIKAVEGTILTVINDLAKFKYEGKDFVEYFNKLVEEGEKSLANTPNLLPVLKEVGVVDSGGAGLIEIFKGMRSVINGEELDLEIQEDFDTYIKTEEHPLNVEDIIYGYCTEMLISLKDVNTSVEKVRDKLQKMGDSIVCVKDEEILKIHVHTEKVIKVFEYGQTLGEFVHIKSENMRIQAIESAGGVVEKVENGIVIVASSIELADLYKKYQNVEVIVGGQTLNPSTEDIVQAIKGTNAKNVIVLPNNSNIIMAAEAAVDLVDDINVKIVKTKHMTQGLECLVNYNSELSLKENHKNLTNCLKNTINYEVTNAIKDTTIDGITIKNNDFLIIKEGKIITSVEKEEEAINFILNDINLDETEILNILRGEDAKVKKTEKIFKKLAEENPFIEMEIHDTNQPVYSYLIMAVAEE